MKYSFVLIAFNESSNIRACIESVMNQKSLSDSYEILVVDDGSTDTTPDIIKELSLNNASIRLITDGKNHGRGFGRWRGVNESTGKYVVMVDADIILPGSWLEEVMPYMQKHDAAGGIAVPDGDVAYVYRRFSLQPKTVMGSTTITGNNGIYKRGMLDSINFDPKLREGEDVDFNHRAVAAGYKIACAPGLTVEHQEHKSFYRSLQWLLQSGIGATRQLYTFRKVRMPDLAYAATLSSAILAALLTASLGWWWTFLLPACAIVGAAFMHILGKFYLSYRWPVRSCSAVLIDSLFIFSYYIGRTIGIGPIVKRYISGETPAKRVPKSIRP